MKRLKLVRIYSGMLSLVAILVFSGCDSPKDSQYNEKDFKTYLEKKYFEIPITNTSLSDFHYRLLSGVEESLENNKGKVILLNFWATWCYPCKQEMPDLEALKHEMKGENFRILAVNSGDKPDKIQAFLEKYPYSFDIVLDEDRDISSSLKIVGLPTTFILNRKLEVIGKVMGPVDWKDDEFVKYLKKISRA